MIAGKVMFKPGKVPPKGPAPPKPPPPKGPNPPPPPPPKGPKGKGPNLLPSTVDMRLAMTNIKAMNQDILTKNRVKFAMMKIC